MLLLLLIAHINRFIFYPSQGTVQNERTLTVGLPVDLGFANPEVREFGRRGVVSAALHESYSLPVMLVLFMLAVELVDLAAVAQVGILAPHFLVRIVSHFPVIIAYTMMVSIVRAIKMGKTLQILNTVLISITQLYGRLVIPNGR
jgi:hypothetical protein